MNKWDYMQLKASAQQEPISKVKDSLWSRKIFANYVSDKRANTAIYKELKQLDSKNSNLSAKDMNRHFSKDIQKVNSYLKITQHH